MSNQAVDKITKLIDERSDVIQMAIAKHGQWDGVEPFKNQVLLAISRNPKLAECTNASIANAIYVLASVGLPANTPENLAYLVPYKKSTRDPKTGQWGDVSEAQVIFDYRGLVEVLYRSGVATSVGCELILPSDEFFHGFKDMQPTIDWKPGPRTEPSIEFTHIMAWARLANGGTVVKVMTRSEVIRYIQETSPNLAGKINAILNPKNATAEEKKGVISDPELWMFKKAAVRQLYKMLPKSYAVSVLDKAESARETGQQIRFDNEGAVDIEYTEEVREEMVEESRENASVSTGNSIQERVARQRNAAQKHEAPPQGGRQDSDPGV